MPFLPVLLELVVRNALIVPPVAIPIMVPVVSPPAWVYVKIETWNMAVISPSPVIIMRAIPTTLPWTPPPPIPEEQINLYIRNNVNIGRIGDHNHSGRRRKCDERREGNMNSNIYLSHHWKRDSN
jgi:hypothetical protein